MSTTVSVCQSVRLSVCVFTFEVPFKRLFAPISRSWMSNIFRDSKSLGKSNENWLSQIWTFLLKNGLKLPLQKKFFLTDFFLHLFTFEVPLYRLFAPTSQSWVSKIFRDSKSLGKSIGKKWSQISTFLLKNGLKSPRRKKILRIFFLICSLLRYHLNIFLPPLLKVECLNFLEIQNPWGKVLKRSGLRFEHLAQNGLKLPQKKKIIVQIFFPVFTAFKRLFAPTSLTPMSKLVIFSESLGKTIGKKWSQIWILFLIKGVKSPHKKNWFPTNFQIWILHKNRIHTAQPWPFTAYVFYLWVLVTAKKNDHMNPSSSHL